ncbi:MAG TPA: YkgJ family cysteine cluster protein [Methanocorpusculum sp.]|nr:YkgJ family cysteine cluster protein [Methanocorpusculum sp.]
MAGTPEAELKRLEEELVKLAAFPREELEYIIREIGFSCSLCGRCCTKEYNGHVFLLAKDTARVKEFAKDAIVPAPGFPYSDAGGNFYVSGYALKTKENGDCIFLENNRCTIYEKRFAICRLYPYMLHREKDARGHLDWRMISGLGEHGSYENEIGDEDVRKIADDTFAYETGYLVQEILFHKFLLKTFAARGEKFVRRDHDARTRAFQKSGQAVVYVFDGEKFVREVVNAP